MELTKKDRVFLINQYEILKRLDPDNSSRYEELIEILRDGYEIFYSMVDEWIDEDMPQNEGKFVLDILNIYRAIENYKRNNPKDKDITEHPRSHFMGFDGNNETSYMAFTRFLIEKQNKFAEQLPYREKTDNFNSHMPVLDKYRSMLDKWIELGRNFELSKEDILLILNA